MSLVYWARLPEHDDITTQGYVGITSATLKHRWGQHLSNASTGKGKCTILENAIRKYGKDGLIVTAVLIASQAYCLDVESRLRPVPGVGWNVGPGGGLTALGVKRTDEVKRKFSEQRKGRKATEEAKANIRAALRTPEARAKVGASSRGRKMPEEAIKRRSESVRGSKRSPETCARIAAGNRKAWVIRHAALVEARAART